MKRNANYRMMTTRANATRKKARSDYEINLNWMKMIGSMRKRRLNLPNITTN